MNSVGYTADFAAAIEAIKLANKLANDGRGSSTARSIITYLESGDICSAKAIWGNDGDKLRQYPILTKRVTDALGCRRHYNDNCNDFICKHLYHSGVGPHALNVTSFTCPCGCGNSYWLNCFATCRKCNHQWTDDFACRWWEKPCPRCGA